MLELTTTSMVVGFDFVEAWPLLMKMLRIEKRIMILLLSGWQAGGRAGAAGSGLGVNCGAPQWGYLGNLSLPAYLRVEKKGC